MSKKNTILTDRDIMKKMIASSVYFVEVMWGKKPWNGVEPFNKEKHITQHQYQLLSAVDAAVTGKGKNRISVRSGHGCHAKGQGIVLFDGSIKNVEDIVVGDQLMGDDNTPRTVQELIRGREKMVRIQYHDGTYYDVNESHILSLVATQTHGTQKRGDIVNIPVKEYMQWSERKRRTHVGYKVSVEFEEKELPIDPYVFGCWLGDGTSDKPEITNVDSVVIDAWEKEARKHGLAITQSRNTVSDCFSYLMSGKKNVVRAALKNLNVLKNKHIPEIYKTASKRQRLELLAGLLDTDGHLDSRSKRLFEITQKNQRLAKDIMRLAQSVGCHATMTKVRKHCFYKGEKREGVYYRVNISRNTETIPTRIERKKAIVIENPQRNRLHYGFTVIPLQEDEYYGFELDGNHLYVLEDFTVTHNTGKSSAVSWILLWYLFTRREAQVPCTSPSKTQMFDVLWKEVAKWLQRMPEDVKNLYEWSNEYVRVVESPYTWFARAKTAKKEAPEALAGIHGEHVLFLIDEASGVPEEVFEVAEGALTGEDVVVVMISNPTRLIGYFYDSHHRDKEDWELLHFDSEESPLVDDRFVQRIINKYGKDSDEYEIRVKGNFPDTEGLDDRGYKPLFKEEDIHYAEDNKFVGRKYLGVDPAGEGSDEAVWVVRDAFKARVVAKEKVSDPESIARKTMLIMMDEGIDDEDVFIDSFGVGADAIREIALAGRAVRAVNVGDKADDPEKYLNKRAEAYWRAREWMKKGNELVRKGDDWNELLTIRYTSTLTSKVKVMPKKDMRKWLGVASPNVADAFMLTFTKKEKVEKRKKAWEEKKSFKPRKEKKTRNRALRGFMY